MSNKLSLTEQDLNDNDEIILQSPLEGDLNYNKKNGF